MASFDQISNNFKSYTKQQLSQFEQQINNSALESDVNALEANLSAKVAAIKQDINSRVDDIQQTIKSRRPKPGDPNYERLQSQYIELLTESVSGMNLLRTWIQNIFNHLKKIVLSIIRWIYEKVANIGRSIRDAFVSLFKLFF
jgi:transcriptional regulator of heat shock response